MRLAALWTAPFLLAALLATTPGAPPIDMTRARELYQKSQRGQALTADEQAYLQRAITQRQQANRGGSPPSTMVAKDSTGLVPLTQFAPGETYKGLIGGLYPDGRNVPPDAQLHLALEAAKAVQPLDAAGKPGGQTGGKIVLLSIGMSNTTQEFSRFQQLANADARKSPAVLLVDGAQGGQDALAWTKDLIHNTNATWEEADRRLHAAGASPLQVQVIWIKQALAGPARYGEFPKHVEVLQQDLETILATARIHYPNLKLAYLSSRIYAGYAGSQLNPEPYAYEGAFAVRGAIEDQLKGLPALNADPARGPVKAPVLLWGPYLWSDGLKGRTLDSLVYTRDDLGPDGTHPSPSGREKVAHQLLEFLTTDATAKPWFLK